MRDLLGIYDDGDKWDQNQNIVIKFMSEGPMWVSTERTTGKVYATGPDMRALFEELVTQEFAPHVNLTFTFIGKEDPRKGDVRVMFHERSERHGGEDASDVGGKRGATAPDEPTMLLIRLAEFNTAGSNMPRLEMVRTMRHEIAHMIGLRHENQHYLNDIPWKSWYELSSAQQELFGSARSYWGQITQLAKTDSLKVTPYDPWSVTHYALPAHLLRDPNYLHIRMIESEESHLSIGDMNTMRQMYPKATYQHTVEKHHKMNANRFPGLREDGITSSTPHIEWKEYETWSRVCDHIYPESSTPDDTGTYKGKKRCSVPDYMFKTPDTVSNSWAPQPETNEEDKDGPEVWVIVVIVLSAMLLLSGGFFLWRKYNRKTLRYDPLPTGERKTQ